MPSPFQYDWHMPPEGVAGGLHGDSSCADMGNTALVPSTPGDAGGISVLLPILLRDPFRRHQVTGGISGKASRLLLSGWSKGTNATYQ